MVLLRRLSRPGHHLDALSRQSEFLALDPRQRRFVMQLAYGVERRRGTLDFYIAELSKRPLNRLDAPVLWILRLALFQIEHLRVPARAAVHEAVESCRRLGVTSAGGFVNALLRRFLRSKPELPQGPEASALAVRTSHPEWLARRYLERYGCPEAEALLEANNQPPRSCFWVNTRRQSLEEMSRLLREADIDSRPWPGLSQALEADSALAVHALSQQGRGFFMDAGSQAVLEDLDLDGCSLLADVCSAPGSKAFLLASRLPQKVRLLAFDRSLRRLREARRRQGELGLGRMSFLQADWEQSSCLAPRCHLVLADVPCSGLGTLRSNPDIRWKFREDGLTRLHGRQIAILEHAYAATAPGGRLLYVTCSSEPEENQHVVEAFLTRHVRARLEEPWRLSMQAERPGDIFFSALLAKPSPQ